MVFPPFATHKDRAQFIGPTVQQYKVCFCLRNYNLNPIPGSVKQICLAHSLAQYHSVPPLFQKGTGTPNFENFRTKLFKLYSGIENDKNRDFMRQFSVNFFKNCMQQQKTYSF